ncbi:hypothetical protein Tco_0063055, partial [Tanacetum coccineum]
EEEDPEIDIDYKEEEEPLPASPRLFRLTLLEQDQVKNREEIQRLKNQVQLANISATLAAMDRD